jgi:hypothetical protein
MLFALSALLVLASLAAIPSSYGKYLSPAITSEHGYSLQQSRQGVPLTISKGIWNFEDRDEVISVIFDVRKDGISLHLTTKSNIVASKTQTFISSPWTPELPGEYEIRTLVVSNLTRPEMLEPLTRSEFKVLSDDEYIAVHANKTTYLPLVPVSPAESSGKASTVQFHEKRSMGNGSNMWVSDIAVTENGLFVIGISEVPPLRENPPMSGGNQLVYFIAGSDDALDLDPMRYLINNSRALIFARSPVVQPVNDTLVFASWLEQAPYRDLFKLIFARSDDNGMTFDTRSVWEGKVPLGDFDIALSRHGRSVFLLGSEVHEYEGKHASSLVFAMSADYGQSFTPKQVVMNSTSNEGIHCTQIVSVETDSHSEIVYLSWRQYSDDGNMKVMFSASHDGGNTFSAPVKVLEAFSDQSDCQWFAAYGDDVYLAWTGTKLIYKPEDPSELLVSDNDLFFMASRDGGRSFESAVNLSEGIGAQTTEAKIIVSEGRIYAVWRDTIPEIMDNGFVNYYGDAEIMMTRSLDGGRTFDVPVNLSNNPRGSYAPDLAIHGDRVVVVWMESDFPSNAAEVSFRLSDDAGRTFAATAENILGGISEPLNRPTVMIPPASQNFYIFWSERPERSSDAEMYVLGGTMDQD